MNQRKWWILAAMSLTLAMISIDQSIAPLALPGIQRDLGLSGNSLYWVMNTYLLMFALTAAIGGRLGDVFGRIKALVIGVLLFAVGTIGSGLAENLVMLIVARALEGTGAAFFVTASAAIVITNFPLEERGKAMGYYNTIAMLMMIAGTLFGGIIMNELSWRWAFFFNVPIVIFVLLVLCFVKPSDEIVKGQRIDYAGVILLIAALVPTVLSIQQYGQWNNSVLLGLLVAGLILLAVFVQVECRSKEPLIKFKLLRDRNFLADAIILCLVQFACFGQGMFGALYLQQILAFNPAVAGAWSLVTLVVITVFVQVGGRILDKTGARLPVIAGVAFMAAGYLSQAPLLIYQNIYYLLPGLILVGIGIGLLMPAAYTDAMNRIAAADRGQASGVIENLRQIGGTVGLAVCGAMVGVIQSSKLAGFAAAVGVAAEKTENLAGLLSEHPDKMQAKAAALAADWQGLITGLKNVVTESFASAYYLSGILMLVCVVIGMVMLRKGRQIEE